MELKNNHQKKCICCGRFFRPDNRVGSRQKSCQRAACRRRRRQIQQERWRKANPDYFTGRYGYVREWRQRHPGYQKQWRARQAGEIQAQIPPVSPIKSIRLNMRAECVAGEIQTLVLTLVKSGQAFWVNGARMHPG